MTRGIMIVLGLVLALPVRADPSALVLVPQVSRSSGFGRIAEQGRYAVRWLGGDTLTLWDHDSGMLLGELTRPPRTRVDCAISPDGRYLAFDGVHEIVIQDLDTGALRRIGPMPNELTGLWFSRDGSRVFAAHAKDPWAASRDHAVSAWSFAAGTKLSEFRTPVTQGASFGARHFVPGTKPDELYWPSHQDVRRYDMTSGRLVEEIALPAELHGATELAISADGTRAVTRHVRRIGSQYDGVVAYWDWSRRAVTRTIPLFGARGSWMSLAGDDQLAIAPDGAHVVVRIPGTERVRLYRFGEPDPVRELEGKLDLLGFTADSRRVVIGTGMYSVATGAPIVPEIPVLGSYGTEVAIHGTSVYVARGKAVSAWDLQNLTRRWTMLDGIPAADVRAVRISPDGTKLTVTSANHTRTFDAATGALLADELRHIVMQPPGLAAYEHSPDGAWVLALRSGSRTAELRELPADRVVRTFELAKPPLVGTEVFRWTGHGFVSSAAGTLQFWKVTSDRPVATHAIEDVPELAQAGLQLAVSPDGNTLAVTRADRAVRVFDAATGAPVRAMDVTSLGYVWRLAIADDRRWAVIVIDGTPVALELARGASVRLIEHADQWVIADAAGVFTASAGAGRLLAAVRGRRGFRIDQLALRNNDPARLMRALGVGSEEQRSYYEQSYRARLRRAGVDDKAIGDLFEAIPEVSFGRVTRDATHADIELELAAPRGLLRYHVDVNGVPVFGSAGKPIRGTRQRETVRVELGRGTNRIELRVVDVAGIEGLRPVHLIDNPAPEGKPDLYFLGFGVSDYANPAYRLAFARKDVIDVAAALEHAGAAFGKVHARVYVDAAVTPDRIRDAKQHVARARVDDVVIVMIAGHGVHSSDVAARYYFVTHGTELERLAETAAPFELVEDLVDGIAARHKLFLMDTCESGERDPEEASAAIARAGSRGLVPRTTRALVRTSGPTQPVPRRFVLERDNFLFNGILRGSGAIVFSSSRGSELSFETEALHNGVFTQALLEALAGPDADADGDGRLAIPELRAYVARRVAEVTDGAQNPTIDRDNLAASLALPVVPAARAIAERTEAPAADYVIARGDASVAPPPPPARSARGCGCGTSAGGSGLALVVLVLASTRLRRGSRRAAAR
jgi:WD40 repeat protein